MIAWCETEAQLGLIGAVARRGGLCRSLCRCAGKSGRALGLRPGHAEQVAIQTLLGTGAYAADTGASMGEIVRGVASPKGTTEQGLAVLDAIGWAASHWSNEPSRQLSAGAKSLAEAARRN